MRRDELEEESRVLKAFHSGGLDCGGANPRVPQIDDTVVYVEFDVCEPLLLSPFVFGSVYGKHGFYGIQAMNFNLVMTGNANRAWRCPTFTNGGDNAIKSATVQSFQNSRLLFQFITPHASDMLDPRNVVPYFEIPLYTTRGNLALPGRVNRG
ncbi:MAG: phage major capsid domain-containing protein, partial [Candidatus Fonsibacter sp.]